VEFRRYLHVVPARNRSGQIGLFLESAIFGNGKPFCSLGGVYALEAQRYRAVFPIT
jgi:hypothetical protein